MSFTGFRNSIEVNSPAVREHGWLAAADVRDVTGEALMGAEYETDTCIAEAGGEWIDKCIAEFGGMDKSATPPTATNQDRYGLYDTKMFGNLDDLVQGDPFVAFVGQKCDLVTRTEGEYEEKSRRKFAMVESRQVDYHMARLIENNGNDLGDCPLSQMIMNADYAALNEYGATPHIFMSAPLMVCAASMGLITPCGLECADLGGAVYRTANGSYVSAIAHDDRNTTANFFMTGHTVLLRGPMETHVVNTVRDNVREALTERIYVPLIECMAYFATATCDAPVTP